MTSSPFISNPETIIFRDFTVGETIEIPFTLTNVSFSRNTYQIKGFDPEYASLFTLVSSPPGYISPGVSVSAILQFTPKYNSVISCYAHFVAKTGPFDIKVECYPKSVNIQLEPFDKLDLGHVTLGEEAEGSLLIRNAGALKANWSFTTEAVPVESGSLTLEEAESAIQFSVKHGSISGYSALKLRINFHPQRPAGFRFLLRFRFTSPESLFDPFIKEVTLVGIGADLPVFLEKDRIDFGVCFYGELYRSSIQAYNRSQLSQRFSIDMPEHLDEFVEFVPKVGFIQPHSSLTISIKLRVNTRFHYTFTEMNQIADIPIKIQVINQVLPVSFSITLMPSYSKLLFDPPSLDFGTFTTTECKQLCLTMKSNIQIPVNYGFVRLPTGVSVQPFDGFGLILPNESINVDISFHSSIPKRHEFEITVITLQGSKFSIPCVANVVVSPVVFSATNITFEATPLGEESNFILNVISTKSQPVDIEFDVPGDFVFDPMVATLLPGVSTPIFISFKPSVPYHTPEEKVDSELSTAKSTTKTNRKQSKTSGKEKAKTPVNDTPRSAPSNIVRSDFVFKIHEHNVACFWKSGSLSGRHHIMINATSVLPTLFVSSITIDGQKKGSDDYIDLALRKVDYDIVAIGQYRDALISVKNATKKNVSIVSEYDVGSFEVLTPSCQIKAQQSTVIRVRFSPSAKVSFVGKLVIKNANRKNNRITISLNGQGAAPSIAISPDSIDFGHVLIGHSVTKSIQIKNNASFGMKYLYRLKPTNEMHTKNLNLTESFNVEKNNEWLDSDSTGQASVTFSPDHDSCDFQNVLVVSAGEDGLSRDVPISGCCWPYLMFIQGGTEEPRQRTVFDHPALDEPYFRSMVMCDMTWPGPGSQTTLIIGIAQQNEEIKKVNGDFVIDSFSVSGFSVSPMKAQIESGGVVKVHVEYSPPASSLLQVGQWIVVETAINLKCGEFIKRVPMKLKCLINLQQQADLTIQSRREGVRTGKKKSRK